MFVRGDEQRPLIGVAALPLHQAAAQIVLGGPHVLQQLGVLRAIRLQPALAGPAPSVTALRPAARFRGRCGRCRTTARQRRSSGRLDRHRSAWRLAGSSSRSDRRRPGGRRRRGSTTRWARAERPTAPASVRRPGLRASARSSPCAPRAAAARVTSAARPTQPPRPVTRTLQSILAGA